MDLKDLANKILETLNGRVEWVDTTRLRKWLGLTFDDQTALRNLMNRMYARKILRRSGVGKFHWKINVKEWQTWNPMAYPDQDNLIVDFAPDKAVETPEEDHKPREDELKEEQSVQEEPVATGELKDLGRRVEEIKEGVDLAHERIGKLEDEDDEVLKLKEAVTALKDLMARQSRVIEVKRYDGKTVKLKNKVLPQQFDHVLGLARCRRNILLVGPAGCGKTHFGRLVADALGLKFGTLSCTAGMSESHLLGRSVPNLSKGVSVFQTTEFLNLYEEGGLFLLDELDAADPNLLLAVNSALANGYCNVPNRPKNTRAEQHDDFVCVATANTYGTGADRVYAGRNQLDEATLDRFRIGVVECDYDETVEAALCPDEELRTRLQTLRTRATEAGLRRVISTRFMRDAYIMVKNDAWTVDGAIRKVTIGWSADEKRRAGL